MLVEGMNRGKGDERKLRVNSSKVKVSIFFYVWKELEWDFLGKSGIG